MKKIIQIADIVPANYRQRIINVWEKMTSHQQRECYYGFGMWSKKEDCKCLGVHNYDSKYCHNQNYFIGMNYCNQCYDRIEEHLAEQLKEAGLPSLLNSDGLLISYEDCDCPESREYVNKLKNK